MSNVVALNSLKRRKVWGEDDKPIFTGHMQKGKIHFWVTQRALSFNETLDVARAMKQLGENKE